jgi:ADP-heptose:LPS heptosyltransferase
MIRKDVKSILVIKWGALGDIIMSTPAIKALRENFPQAKITILSNGLMKEILPEGFLNDELIMLRTNDGKVDEPVWKQLLLVCRLRKRKFDLAVNLRWTSERCAVIAYLSGARERIGSGPKNLMNLYTTRVEAPEGRYHEIHRNLDIVKGLGLNVIDECPVLFISKEEQRFADGFFSRNSLERSGTICVHPGASRPVRAWMPERFREIIKRIVEQLKVRVIVTWGENEWALAHRVADGLGTDVVVCDRTESVGALAAIIKSSKMFFSNCTGPMNVAVAVGTPVVALLGSSHPDDWGAYGKDHINIKSPLILAGYTDEDEHEAMMMITVERVWEAIRNRWKDLNADMSGVDKS